MDGPRSVGQSGVTVGDRSSGRSGGGGSHGSGGGSGGGGPCDGKSGRSLVVPAARSAWAWLYHRGYIKALFSTTTPTTTPSTITYFYSHMTNATPLSRLSPLSVRPLLLVSSSPMLSSSSSSSSSLHLTSSSSFSLLLPSSPSLNCYSKSLAL